MSKNPKVLIGVATASQKDYCVEEFKQQLKSFTYDNYDVFIVDNSEDKNHIEVFKDFDVVHSSRFKENGNIKAGHEMLRDCQNEIRAKFLENDYDFLFMLESDVFIDKDFIQYAVSFDAPVYTVQYPIKVRYEVPTPCVQYLHVLRHKGINKIFSNSLMLPPSIYFPSEVKPITHFKIGDRMMLTHTGLGCTLIRKDVVKYVPFRTDETNDKKTRAMTFSDTFFYTDCLMKKIEVLYDNRYIAQHNKQW